MTSKKMIKRSQSLANNFKLSHKLIQHNNPEEPQQPTTPLNGPILFPKTDKNQIIIPNLNSNISGKEIFDSNNKIRNQQNNSNQNSSKKNKNSIIEETNTNIESTINNTETPIVNIMNSPKLLKRESGARLSKLYTPKVSFKDSSVWAKKHLKSFKSLIFPPAINKGQGGERLSIIGGQKKARLSKNFFNFNLDKKNIEKEKSAVGMLVGNNTNNFSSNLFNSSKSRKSFMTILTNGEDDKNFNLQYNFNRIKTKVFDEKQLKKINTKFNNMNHNAVNNKEISQLEKLRNKMVKYHLVCAIYCFFSLVCACIDLELYITKSWIFLREKYFKNQNKITVTKTSTFKDIENRKLTFGENFSRILNGIFCLLGLITYILQIVVKVKLIKGYNPIQNNQNQEIELSLADLEGSKQNKLLIFIKGFIIILFYPPYINKVICSRKNNIVYAYPLNAIFFLFNCFKLIHIFSFYKRYIRYNSFYSQKICYQRGIKLTNSFIFKASYSRYPLVFSFSWVIIIAVLCSFLLHGIEALASDVILGIDDYTNENGLSYYFDNLVTISWLILKNFSCTLIPMTNFGKFILFIFGVFGSGFICIFMKHLNSIYNMNEHEKKAYSKLEKLFDPENKMHKAANLIKLTLVKKRLLILFETKKLNEKDMSNEKKYVNFIYERNMFYIHKFILTVKTNMYSKEFTDEYKVAKNFSLPLDDILISFKDRMIENQENEEEIVDDFEYFGGLKPILEGMQENGIYFIKRIYYCNKIQSQIIDYLIEYYGELFNGQKSKRKIDELDNEN